MSYVTALNPLPPVEEDEARAYFAKVGGCTVNNGALCSEQDPMSATCAVCLQEAQCQGTGDNTIVAANNDATKQNEEDEARGLYEEAQNAYATAARERSEQRVEWARAKARYDSFWPRMAMKM